MNLAWIRGGIIVSAALLAVATLAAAPARADGPLDGLNSLHGATITRLDGLTPPPTPAAAPPASAIEQPAALAALPVAPAAAPATEQPAAPLRLPSAGMGAQPRPPLPLAVIALLAAGVACVGAADVARGRAIADHA